MLMLLHFISAYPGGMSPDTIDQYQQSLSHNYNSHHPPLMAMLWSLFNYIYQGPQTMLLLQLTFLWGGVLLLYYSDIQNKYRFLYFLIPLLPNILSQSGTIWKDVGFSLGGFFIATICIFYTYRQKPMPILVLIGLSVICFYVVGIKFQAKFIVPILIFFAVSLYCKRGLAIRLIMCAGLSFVIITTNILLSSSFSINTHSEQLRQIFDIAGISVNIGNDDVFPKYVKESPRYSFEKIKEQYTPKWVDPLIFYTDSVYRMTSDPKELQELNAAFCKAVIHHPLAYLKHRAKNFMYLTAKGGGFRHYAFFAYDDAEKIGLNTGMLDNPVKGKIVKYLKLFPTILTTNAISLLLVIMYFTHIMINRKISDNPELIILQYITLISVVFSTVLFFTTMAADYRYYYIVRILSLFGLPIYLKVVFNKKNAVIK
jgi:hypothetical protein